MTSAVTLSDYDKPCPVCDGVKYYRTSSNCVRCTMRIKNKKIKDKAQEYKSLQLITNNKSPKHSERIIMAGVKYQDMERVTL